MPRLKLGHSIVLCAVNVCVAVNCSITGSTALKCDDLELTSSGSHRPASGQDDATSTTALAGSFVSNAAATVDQMGETALAPEANVQL